jgi:hypothetical protein
MREVSPGDIIFSFRDTRIAALGIARSYCYESPKPTEFGTAGRYWEAIGWKLDVSFRELTNRIHPKSHIGELRGLLPQKHSPLRANGDGLQSGYLPEVGRPFAAALFRLIGGEANRVAHVAKEVDRAAGRRSLPKPSAHSANRGASLYKDCQSSPRCACLSARVELHRVE